MVIEQTRRIAIEGLPPNLMYILLGTIFSVILCEIAYRGFQRARRGRRCPLKAHCY